MASPKRTRRTKRGGCGCSKGAPPVVSFLSGGDGFIIPPTHDASVPAYPPNQYTEDPQHQQVSVRMEPNMPTTVKGGSKNNKSSRKRRTSKRRRSSKKTGGTSILSTVNPVMLDRKDTA